MLMVLIFWNIDIDGNLCRYIDIWDDILRLGITRIFSMLMVVMGRLLDVDGSDSSIFRCGMAVIMQTPIIAIAIFILVDDRWGLALT